MAIDHYSLCPGGKDKKVKFCCPDLLGELDKIQRMFEGDQRQACLDYIAKLEQKFPDRACLLSTKAMLQSSLGEAEGAQESVSKLLEAEPDNPVGLAERALLLIANEGAQAGVEPIHRAFAASKGKILPSLFEGLISLAAALAAEEYWLAALAHLRIALQIRGDFAESFELLLRISATTSVPLVLKDAPRPFDQGPVAAEWRADFQAALEAAQGFRWLDAAERFARLSQRAPDAPAVWRNLGMLRAYLADNAGAAAALHHYAQLDVPLDDAVEAEAVAQLLDEDDSSERTELVFQEYPLADLEQFEQRLSASPYAERTPADQAAWEDAEQPPPRSVFWLLDRPMPASGVGLAIDDIPNGLTQLFLFGRETDRPARLSFAAHRDQLEAVKSRIAEISGEPLAAPSSEEVVGSASALQHALEVNWRLPRDTPADHMRALVKQRRRQSIFEIWPKTGNRALGGRSPAEAAGDQADRVRLLAAVLNLELSTFDKALDFNALRSQLGLPPAEEIEATEAAAEMVTLARLHRLNAGKLSDDNLVACYQQAVLTRDQLALKKLIPEVVSRPSLDQKVDKAQAYGLLASGAKSLDEAIGYVDQARKAAEAAGNSSAPWDIEELVLRLTQGDATGAERLLRHIQTAHGREPGVRQRLAALLYQMGLIDEQGRAVGRAAEEPAGLVVPGGSAEAAGKLWMPGSESGEGKKSALWVPGMD